MRRFIIIVLALVCSTCSFLGINAIARNHISSSRMEYWNRFEESPHLKSVRDQSRDLDCELSEMKQRRETINRIAISVCNGQIGVDLAIDSIRTLVQNSFYRDVDLRTGYIAAGYLRPCATERDAFACYLLLWIKGMQLAAEQAGDETSTAFFSHGSIHIYNETNAQSQGLLPAILDPLEPHRVGKR